MRGRYLLMKFKRIAVKATTVLLVILFAILSSAVALGGSITTTLRDPEILHALLLQQEITRYGQSFLADKIISYAVERLYNVENLNGSTRLWTGVGQTIFPTEWLDDTYKTVIKNALGWLEDADYQNPTLTIGLFSVKQVFDSPAGVLAILPFIQDAPRCPPEGVPTGWPGDHALIPCIPSDRGLTQTAQAIAHQVGTSLPYEISVYDMLDEHELERAAVVLPQIHAGYQALIQALVLGFSLSLLLLNLIAILHSGSAGDIFRALSTALYTAWLLSLALIAGGYVLIRWGANRLLPLFLDRLVFETRILLTDSIQIISPNILRSWLYWAFLLMVGGMLLQGLPLAVARIKGVFTPETRATIDARRRIRKPFR